MYLGRGLVFLIFLVGPMIGALPLVLADNAKPSFNDLYQKSIEDRAKAGQAAQAAEQAERDYQKAKDSYDKAEGDFLNKWADASDAIKAYKYSKSSKEKSADANKPGSSLTPAERAAQRAAADRLDEAEQESLSKQFEEDEAKRDQDAAQRAMDEARKNKDAAAAASEKASQEATDSEAAAQEADPDAYSEKSMHFGMGDGPGDSDSQTGSNDDGYWDEFNDWLDNQAPDANNVTQSANEFNKTSETPNSSDTGSIASADSPNPTDTHQISTDVVSNESSLTCSVGAPIPAQGAIFGDTLNIRSVPTGVPDGSGRDGKGNKGFIFRKDG